MTKTDEHRKDDVMEQRLRRLVEILATLSPDDAECLVMLAIGLTWDGPQREMLRGYAHGIADQLLPREVARD